MSVLSRYERQQVDVARITRDRYVPTSLWHGAPPARAPAGTLVGPTGRTVTHDCYVLAPENFERAEQAIALCMAHGLLPAGRG